MPSKQIPIENPLLGHKLTQITSTSCFTEVLIVRNSFYKKFLSVKSEFSQLNEKVLRVLLEKELGIKDAGAREKA